MKRGYFVFGVLLIQWIFFFPAIHAQARQVDFSLENNKVHLSVFIDAGQLTSDRLAAKEEWTKQFFRKPAAVVTDADFILNVMWTGWSAPGMINNAENPVLFSKKDFSFISGTKNKVPGQGEQLVLLFQGKNNPFQLRITYSLKPDAFFVRRTLAIRDTTEHLHYLRKITVLTSLLKGNPGLIKEGGFGQPVAFTIGEGGSFIGLEYPTSENKVISDHGRTFLQLSEVIGKIIGKPWIESDPVVEAITPDPYVKNWFSQYLDDIRVAPVKPYTLYNSWYDLRSPVMVKDSSQVMNEENIKRIIHLFKKNMIVPYGIHLDAFVLDDGWDVYHSDWVLRKKQFPHGLKPISDELAGIHTKLGIWFGPIGGYSHRNWRLDYMKAHGYETVGNEMCLAGKNYSQLFKKRVVDFVRKDDVEYYKWDGIQFSCSEPDHGHPIGIYSQRAIMDTVISMCHAVRQANPNVYLNITSGTWLSPWWLKYANQIWMQGGDYGFSKVPSISRRDAAITYRDFVLYEDFQKNHFWFPISNMMTHGIIKGSLQQLAQKEPLDKFTDNALLYFARGVSMYELYVSPDILTDGEWKALSKSMKWAKDRFDILKHTEMIGGDPGEEQPYGYVHFTGNHGIIAVRNPYIAPKVLPVILSPALGMDPEASSLVLERVYPSRWISPELYAAGVQIDLPLDGYETAIYEVYPVGEAQQPLLSGPVFEVKDHQNNRITMNVYKTGSAVKLLNPESISKMTVNGKKVNVSGLQVIKKPVSLLSQGTVVRTENKKKDGFTVSFHLNSPVKSATLAILMESDKNNETQKMPELRVTLDGKQVNPKTEQQKGVWKWVLTAVTPGQHTCHYELVTPKSGKKWTGKVSAWMICRYKPDTEQVVFTLTGKAGFRPMPPNPESEGMIKKTLKVGYLRF